MSRPAPPPGAAPSDWFERWFDAEAYEWVYARRDGAEAARLLDLIERAVRPEPGAEVLDVGCGRGRHSLALARRGYRVTGLDLAARALAAARRRADAAGLSHRTRFVRADMRAVPFQAAFDGAVNLFTSFGFFDAEADHERALRGVAGALRPGGWFVQDFLNVSAVVAGLVPEDEREVRTAAGTLRVHQRRWLADGPGGPRVRKRITLTDPDGGTRAFDESVRLLRRADFDRLYASVGLRIEARYGDYDGGPHGERSPRLVLVARRGPPSPG